MPRQRTYPLAIDLDHAGVGRMHARHQLDQGRLAAAVLADQTMYFAGHDRPIDAVQRLHATEALGDVAETQKWSGPFECLRHVTLQGQ